MYLTKISLTVSQSGYIVEPRIQIPRNWPLLPPYKFAEMYTQSSNLRSQYLLLFNVVNNFSGIVLVYKKHVACLRPGTLCAKSWF